MKYRELATSHFIMAHFDASGLQARPDAYAYHDRSGQKRANNVTSLLLRLLRFLKNNSGWAWDYRCGGRLSIIMDTCVVQNKTMSQRAVLMLVELNYFKSFTIMLQSFAH
jgi:hypothetical protein